MTISTTASRISYNGNGATTAFSFPYRFLTNADLTVIKVAADGTETTLVLNTNYTVTGADDDAGGTVTLSVAPLSGQRLVIFREIDITQEVDYITGDAFPAETHERALDRLTMIAQQHQDAIDRSAKLPETSTEDADALIADIIRLADSADEIDTVAGIEANVTTVAGIAANVTTVAGIAANVTTVAGISANVTSVAGNATNINTVAGNNSNVTTVAGISAAVSAVAADATDIGTVSTNIASVNSAATNMAAIIAAPTEASNAAASAVAAANSAASAATALDSFDDRYLGSKASDPTLDNDGNALITGALYYSTSTQSMKVYDGANWITATAAGTTSMLVYKYVATAGQTTFSGAASVGGTMSYTSGNIIVFLNGASLDSTDYTATNGTSVVLGSAAALNDELVVVAFKSFTVADTYTKGEVDAFAVKLTGDQTIAGVKTFSGATTVMNGNVGIGTSSPAYKLQVTTASSGAVSRMNYTGGSRGSRIEFGLTETAGGVENYIDFSGSSGTSAGIFKASGSEAMRIDSSGNLLVGTTSYSNGQDAVALNPVSRYFSRSSTGSQYQIIFANPNGTIGRIETNGSSTSFVTSSDYRLKENIAPMTGALSVVQQLNPVTYNWKVDGSDGQGFIAHELQAVVPECVTGEKDAVDADGNPQYQGVDTSFLVATLTAAIQEQQALIATLTERITALEGKA